MLTKLKRDAAIASTTSEGPNKKRRTNHDSSDNKDDTVTCTPTSKKLLSFPKVATRKIYLACPPNVQTVSRSTKMHGL